MVNVLSNDWQQIEQAGLDRVDPIRKLRKPTGKFRKPLRLERGIHDDAAAFAKRGAQRGDELAPGIAGICGKKLVMLQCLRRAPSASEQTTGTAFGRKDASPRNRGIAQFTVSKSIKDSGYFSPLNTSPSSGLNHGSPVCTHVAARR